MLRKLFLTLALCLCALAVASVATAAKPVKADKHDRALIKQLLATPILDFDSFEEGEELSPLFTAAEACPAWQAADGGAELAIHLILPLALEFVDRGEPHVQRYQQMIDAMRPHARVFKQWIAMKRKETANLATFVAAFDSSRMDVCAYLDAAVAAGDDEDALDLALLSLFAHPDDLRALVVFGAAEEAEDAGRKALNKRFATFLKASGYSRAQIATLTG